jgi:hypothetical protein
LQGSGPACTSLQKMMQNAIKEPPAAPRARGNLGAFGKTVLGLIYAPDTKLAPRLLWCKGELRQSRISAAAILFEPVSRFVGNPVSCSGFGLELAHLNALAVRESDAHTPARLRHACQSLQSRYELHTGNDRRVRAWRCSDQRRSSSQSNAPDRKVRRRRNFDTHAFDFCRARQAAKREFTSPAA